MKILLTGSTGNITKPLAQKLVAAGHSVSVVTSQASKVADIESLGAKALVGSVEDYSFLASAFSGQDAVYLIIPPKWNIQDSWIAYQQGVADNFVKAIDANGIKYAVVLSSVGAHMRKGCGPVDGLGYLEERIFTLENVHARVLRPSYFFYNLFSMKGLIQHMGIIGSAQPADHKLVLTDTNDIAEVAFEELNTCSFSGHSIRYIASDERTWTEIASVLGAAIGKPNLPFVEFTDAQSEQGMLQMGLPKAIVDGYVAMGAALRSGEMEADFKANRPAVLGKTKLEDFAKIFAHVYSSN